MTMEYIYDALAGSLYRGELLRCALDDMGWRENGTLNILDGRRCMYKGVKHGVAIDGNFSSYEFIIEGLVRLQIGFDAGKIEAGILMLTAQRSDKSPYGSTVDMVKSEVTQLHTEVQCHLDPEFMSLSIPDGNKAFDINGDRFKPGISISNSEVGLASLSIAAFVLRLVCTNGMVAKTDVSASYRHVSTKVLMEFPQMLDKVFYELGTQRTQFQLSMESPVDDPLSTMNSFNRQFGVNNDEKEALAWAWQYEIGNTMFHVVNAYTRAAQMEGLSAESSYRLQKVGGNILGMLN